jgi:hypothetical protein
MLFHFSEDPTIETFAPHVAASRAGEAPLVWAIDAAHAPGFWFPRDCPRACCWLRESQHAHALLAGGVRLHAIQRNWLARLRACALYVYAFDPAPFVLHDAEAGHWVARRTVRPLSVAPVGDLEAKHRAAGIALRVVDDLRPLIEAIVASGLGFSIYRMRNL